MLDRTVEMDPAGQVVGKSLVDRDVAVRLDADEVGVRDRVGAERHEREQKRRPPVRAAPLAGGRCACAGLGSRARRWSTGTASLSVSVLSRSRLRLLLGLRSLTSSSNRTTLMLSSPPAWLAACDQLARGGVEIVACGRRACARSPRRRPSRSARRSRAGRGRGPSPRSEKRSTSTSGSVPSARVMTERCGCVSASSGERRPLRTSSATSE